MKLPNRFYIYSNSRGKYLLLIGYGIAWVDVTENPQIFAHWQEIKGIFLQHPSRLYIEDLEIVPVGITVFPHETQPMKKFME